MWITESDKKNFRSIVILNELQKEGRIFKTIFNGDDKILEPLFLQLMGVNAVAVKGDHYVITESGKKIYDLFMSKYFEYLKVYDVYGFIDLTAAEFAFARFFDFNTDAEWDAFKSNERFEDLRIAVALFKKINAAECVFMSFINEDRFDTAKTGWQVDLMADIIWDQIEAIIETAYKPEQLGEDAMVDLINQGSKIMIDLVKKEFENQKAEKARVAAEEAKIAAEQPVETVTTTVTETIIEDDDDWVYYESYYDPYYVPLFWYDPYWW